MISGAIGAACVWLIFLYNVFGAKNFMRGSEHGSARWGTAKDIKPLTDRVISSERNPDVSEYARELDAYVKDMIVGTWKGTFDEWPTADSIYWSYTFSADGTYSFTNGTTTEAGTYTITSDPNNNYYHSSMQLTFDGGERTMQFYFTTTNPVKMITDDQTDPTYLKSLV